MRYLSPSTTLNSFAERFKYARERSGLSLTKIADGLGVTSSAVWNYENRPEGNVTVELLFPLADMLQVEPRWLATGDGVMCDSETATLAEQRVQRVARSLALLTDERLQALSVLLGIKIQ